MSDTYYTSEHNDPDNSLILRYKQATTVDFPNFPTPPYTCIHIHNQRP